LKAADRLIWNGIWNTSALAALHAIDDCCLTVALECATQSKSVAAGEERTFVLILDQGEEAFKAITDFANKQGISGASVSAVGAFAEARVGWFDLSRADQHLGSTQARATARKWRQIAGSCLTH
jgi:hypothetical protein